MDGGGHISEQRSCDLLKTLKIFYIKKLCPSCNIVLTIMFQLQEIPEQWKISKTIPVRKKDLKTLRTLDQEQTSDQH